MIRRLLLLAVLLSFGALMGWKIWHKERVIARGRTVLLELAPVDPRSLIQGDYMRLRYAETRWRRLRGEGAALDISGWPTCGEVVIARDAQGVGHLRRRYRGGKLGADELRLDYRLERPGSPRADLLLAPESYFIPEGSGGHFAAADYAILKVGPGGDRVLTGLADAERARIRPPRPEGVPP